MFPNPLGGPPHAFQFFFFLIFAVVICGFAFAIVKGLSTWTRNNASELISRPARVVAKRTNVWGGSGESSSSTSYYVTFEAEDGSRAELAVNGKTYGMLAEGDVGQLTHQGTRYKGFDRHGRANEAQGSS
ncbi:DUF2500 domain-containing protein [Cohnella nanjingensis]|uniref:DUF2500 domain-containing protein n=1 Tax=Cohnella nanjingensis TaxID=1387779 RepID=A0A7X0RQ28_9BACL|nr:DUF2500 domain-containing protein [Cohnella nanjingensis]MBB6671622.1 DUF2500 domain-containing protein [Cohnella nanjingensis]